MREKSIKNILIVSVTPYFLEKEAFWFEEHLQEIITSTKTQPFFQDNTLFLEASKRYHVSELLRKLDEMGYERVFEVKDLGEFSQRGGVVDVSPINRKQAVRLDFLGNTLEEIVLLDIVIADEEKAKEVLAQKLKNQKLFSDVKHVKPGDYVVHLDHGVGMFIGIETLQGENYYALSYANGDKLYVPVGLERKLSRYLGFSDPVVSRLGSSFWQKTKRKIKEDVEKLAQEILWLYSQREAASRSPYVPDEILESQLRASFLHQETPDQLQAMEDIKHDLAKERPMDRIVCGDVGFGKTEVALRASLLAAANGRQTAIICPTTILANQHFNTFKKRFEKLPATVAVLSRLQTSKEQKKVIKAIKEGVVDVVIGTHRLLSVDLAFKNLQLLIIDDEQRFGVKQKEKLRQKNPSLDILSLSATPIPRTMYLALASFKSISLMQTSPQGRQAIKTTILSYHPKRILEAIEVELQCGGQVYFLHNRVETIERTKERLGRLVSQATIAAIHGRMPEKELVKIMDEFEKGKIQVLVATTIIENGIDLSSVNTIIVEDASRLGLSQAYQIRGRVGRADIKSYAYFFYQKKLTALAKERLKALSEATELGAGYRIAIKDLELRGAGNILGREQSGAINKVGLNLYCQMLAESIEKMKQ